MASNFPAEVLHPFSGIIRRREDREQMQSSNKNIVRVKDGDMSTGTMSQRKRPVSREKDALSTKSRLNLETDGAGDESIAANAPATVPIEVLDTVFEVRSRGRNFHQLSFKVYVANSTRASHTLTVQYLYASYMSTLPIGGAHINW